MLVSLFQVKSRLVSFISCISKFDCFLLADRVRLLPSVRLRPEERPAARQDLSVPAPAGIGGQTVAAQGKKLFLFLKKILVKFIAFFVNLAVLAAHLQAARPSPPPQLPFPRRPRLLRPAGGLQALLPLRPLGVQPQREGLPHSRLLGPAHR